MPDDDLTPTDEQVRRLLADARHTEPMPDDVADRLDGVLAGLRAEPVRSPVADIAAARRRRTARNWLLAAAAVVIVGVGINQVDWSGMSEGDDAASGAADSQVSAENAPNDSQAEAPTSDAERRAARWKAARLLLHSDRFGDQVDRFRRSTTTTGAEASPEFDSGKLTDGSSAYAVTCDVGKIGPGEVVPVKYDGARAWLVLRKPAGDSQVVDLYLCGADEPTRSITLPAP